jgi:hypothetical protein
MAFATTFIQQDLWKVHQANVLNLLTYPQVLIAKQF